jgi:four helix bundle protein
MKTRTKRFALRVLKLVQSLPKSDEARTIGRQLLRSGTSVGANYRAVCRARSRKEFVSKMNVVVEEADETVFWFELLVEGAVVATKRMTSIMDEGNQLLAIFGASLRTAKKSGRPTNDSMTR